MNVYSKEKPMNIVLGVDGSKHALAGAALLRDLPLPPSSTITALQVFSPRQAAKFKTFEQSLEQTRSIFTGKPFQVSTELLAGSPAEVITQFTQERQTDLIVLGAKGLRATLGILLGGVAQQVVEYCRTPVLVVRAPYRGLQKIAFVTDGSPYSDYAADFLGNFPIPYGAEVLVLNVLPPLPEEAPEVIAETWPLGEEAPGRQSRSKTHAPDHHIHQTTAWSDDEALAGRSIIDHTVSNLQQAFSRRSMKNPLGSVLLRGDAATEIIEYSLSQQIDLLVAGSRGLSQMQSWLLGSVSRKLLHYAQCSVLIVREEQLEQRRLQ